MLAPLVAGAGIAMGQAPFSLAPVALLALVLALVLAMTAPGRRQVWRRGFLVGFGHALVAMHWIVEPFAVDAAQTLWMAPFALALMAAGFGIFWGLGWWLAAGLCPAGWRRVLGLALGWTGAEIARAYLFGGLPWALVSHLWIDTPAYGLAAVVGPHGLGLATFVGAAITAAGIAGRRWGALILGPALLVALPLGAPALLAPATGAAAPNGAIVRLIQPNAPQKQKWDPAFVQHFYTRQLEFSAAPVNGAGAPALVVWPEVAVPFTLESAGGRLADIASAAAPARAVIGAVRLQGPLAYNSMALLDGEGGIAQLYDKEHLVPFGEYIPGGDSILAHLGLTAFSAQHGFGYTAGAGRVLVDGGAAGRFLPLICYEGIFANEIRSTRERPDWILLITNDAWFGTAAGPQQHFAQARARSIEFGLPMVRVANTGISGVIDSQGTVVARLPFGEAGYLDAAIPPAAEATAYWRHGDSPVFLAVIVLCLLCAWPVGRDSD